MFGNKGNSIRDKTILDCISGTFRAGDFSVIIGPSGSGKTTILNLLSGMCEDRYHGTLKIDIPKAPNYKLIRNQSSYIMHDRMLHPQLTVTEAMSFAVKFKTSPTTTAVQQKCKCDTILSQLGLTKSSDTLTRDLSGGERKRLSIAVELVSDPSILFLDEPTTGLDSFSSSQIVTLLGDLAKTGKSIICSIHAPSALMFQTFDHVYAIAQGKCIYQGSSANVIPFLTELDMVCPESYNPADYLIEIATNQYGDLNQNLTEKISNGLSDDYRTERVFETDNDGSAKIEIPKYRSTFSCQLLLLIQRNFLLMRRNKDYSVIRFVASVVMGIVIGASFYNIGQFANHTLDIYKYLLGANQYLMFASFYSLSLRFPMDFPILWCEHFNRWYSSLSYYLALIIADIPVLVGVTVIFTVITYYLSGQPMEERRLLLTLCIGILLSFTAQAFGLLASSIFSNLTISLVIGSGVIAFHTVFAGIIILKRDVQPWLNWVFDVNYLYYANNGMLTALFGYDRDRLQCDHIYCHFRDPKDVLKLLNIPATISFHSFFIIFFIVHICTFINMTMKLRRLKL